MGKVWMETLRVLPPVESEDELGWTSNRRTWRGVGRGLY